MPKLSKSGFISLSVLLLILAAGILAPYISPYEPNAINPVDRLQAPSWAHLFGTDNLGRDIFSRVIWGSQISLLVAVSVPIVAGCAGLLLGLIAGYVRPLDGIIMRVMDGIMAIPEMLLAIALAAAFSSSIQTVIIAIAIPEIPRTTRLIRGIVLSLREALFVEAAISMGAGFPRILLRHIAPNAVATLTVQMIYVGALAILVEAYLSFLGVGVPPGTSSWGTVVAEGRSFVSTSPWGLVFPGFCIAILVLSANVLIDDLKEQLEKGRV